MDRTPEATALLDALENEVSLLDSFVEKERELRQLVMDRNWPALESVIRALNAYASRIESVEETRHQAFRTLAEACGLPAESSFYDLVTHIPQEMRHDLVELFRELKVAVMRVEGLNSGIETFVQSRTQSLNDVLEVFGPSHRGRVYGRDGAQTRKGREALVVDTAR